MNVRRSAWMKNQNFMEGILMKMYPGLCLFIVTVFSLPQLAAAANQDDEAPAAEASQDEAAATAEAFRLFKNEPAGIQVHGWMAVGNGGLSDHDVFNNLDPTNTGLNQLGISMDKSGEKYRLHLDLLYGRDAVAFRSAGNAGNGWDNSDGFVHDDHAWALPQAFAEASVGDLTVRGGHFLMTSHSGLYSTDRFFATRTASEYSIEPYTLSGVVVDGKLGQMDTTVGWVAGTNTGFDSMHGGSSTFVLGIGRSVGDKWSVRYDALVGDVGFKNAFVGGVGRANSYYHALTARCAASDKLTVEVTHVYQNLPSENINTSVVRQAAFYVLSDSLTLGQRYERYSSSADGASLDSESASVGLNYRNAAWSNVLLRPEIRWEETDGSSRTDFYMDVVVTF